MAKKANNRDVLFNKVRSTIKAVRKQGDPPDEDLESMDGYKCDLCLDVIKRARILQCPFCGRWVCRNQCYSEDDMVCMSCAGVVRLMRESMVLGSMDDEKRSKGKK